MEKEIIIEMWDDLTQVLFEDEILWQFNYTPDLHVLEVVLGALGYNVEILDMRTPEDFEDADEAFYDEVVENTSKIK